MKAHSQARDSFVGAVNDKIYCHACLVFHVHLDMAKLLDIENVMKLYLPSTRESLHGQVSVDAPNAFVIDV